MFGYKGNGEDEPKEAKTYIVKESDCGNIMNGVIDIICPHCKGKTFAEPDADSHYCFKCGGYIEIINKFF